MKTKILFGSAVFLFFSCNSALHVEKRKYMPGYYVAFSKNKSALPSPETDKQIVSEQPVAVHSEKTNEPVVADHISYYPEKEVFRTKTETADRKILLQVPIIL